MTYEVVSCEKGCAFGFVIRSGTLEDCCKYAKIHSKDCGIALLVRPRESSFVFVNGKEIRVR